MGRGLRLFLREEVTGAFMVPVTVLVLRPGLDCL